MSATVSPACRLPRVRAWAAVSGSATLFSLLAVLAIFTLSVMSLSAKSEVRMNMEFSNTVYRALDDNWYYVGSGLADMRIASVGNDNMRAEVALEFYPDAASPELNLKRMWFKANFPSWRLTAGKTKVAWGNGSVFNAGDILFGSMGPFLDFSQSTLRDDTAWLTAVNIPTGDFSYIEAVLLPPDISLDGGALEIQTIDKSSGGLRYFFRVGGWRLEAGYLYKGDAKTDVDLLGHRPYFSFHTHAGVDWYGALSLAAGADSDAGINRDNWDEINDTINFSLGLFHQVNVGYDSILAIRFESLMQPWQNWSRVNYLALVNGTAGYYGILLYPELTLTVRSLWWMGLQSVISPVDGSAQLTASVGWDVFQGFKLLGFFTVNAGDSGSLFAFDRSGTVTGPPEGYGANGVRITLAARYSF